MHNSRIKLAEIHIFPFHYRRPGEGSYTKTYLKDVGVEFEFRGQSEKSKHISFHLPKFLHSYYGAPRLG